jgi:arylsulfatase A-like enzyme
MVAGSCVRPIRDVSKDLGDKAIEMLRDQKAANPSRPWFMWWCPGANHAPHHCPKDYVERYRGKFDDGYEAYRTWVLERMIDKGIMRKGTQLPPLVDRAQYLDLETELKRSLRD